MIVAELSGNHGGDRDRAMGLVRLAKDCGADAVKFQLYWPEEMCWPGAPPLTTGPWAGRTLFDLYSEARTPPEWFPDLFARARDIGIEPFSSVFSERGIELLEGLDCPRYKIASAEAAWPELAQLVVATGKPIIVSDGMALPHEILDAVGPHAYRRTTVLRCVAQYPAPAGSYGFGDCIGMWGVSDHSVNPMVPAAATAMGATVVEAHLRDLGPETPDFAHSYGPGEFYRMARMVRDAEAIASAVSPGPDLNSPYRRRLVWLRDLQAGHKVVPGDYAALRHPEGAEPNVWGVAAVGRVLREPVKAGAGVDPANLQGAT